MLSVQSGISSVWAQVLVAAGLWVGCVPTGGTTQTPTSNKEAFGDLAGVQCSAVRPQTEPDLMAWDPGSRMNLNNLRHQGVVAVRYQATGCNVELELIPDCVGKSQYQYAPYASNDRKLVSSKQELFAELPLGAARLAGRLDGEHSLRADYMLVGMAAIPATSVVQVSDLEGPGCGRATHVISRVYLGGFGMASGNRQVLTAQSTVFGAGLGGNSDESVARVANEGNPDACAAAQQSGQERQLCAVPLRVGLLALHRAVPVEPSQPGPVKPILTPPAASTQQSVPPTSGTMRRIPAGTFEMGSNRQYENPVHSVEVAAFQMDVTQVTVASYRACVSTGVCSAPEAILGLDPPPGKKGINELCNWGKNGKDNHPINCVDWQQAKDFLRMGRQTSANGGRVGICCPKHGREHLSMGRGSSVSREAVLEPGGRNMSSG